MSETKICPKCEVENPVVANFCRHCRYEFPEATKNGLKPSPSILSYTIKENSYTIGSIIHFNWKVDNATAVAINEVDVTSLSELEVTVDKAATYTLTVENDYDKSSKSIRLSPRPLPVIQLFSSNMKEIRNGQDVKLKWDVRNSVKTELYANSAPQDVTGKDFIKLSPKSTTRYTLRCYSDDSKIFIEESLAILVLAEVKINSFKADKNVVPESEVVTLTWDVENATNIMLLPIMKDLTGLDNYQVSPTRTTEYKLQVRNSISTAEAGLSIGVRQLPKVDLDFAKMFCNIDIPSCKVNLDFISESMKKDGIDMWMSDTPVKDVNRRIKLYTGLYKLKEAVTNIVNRK